MAYIKKIAGWLLENHRFLESMLKKVHTALKNELDRKAKKTFMEKWDNGDPPTTEELKKHLDKYYG
jgi:hypothetical protein